ncbi:MAG: alpha/beta hydrolase [Actinomycetota bacterium]|nr:alpha/beta hydrolase [Actinomycetota bacterium]
MVETERTEEVDGLAVTWRETGEGAPPPVLYLHGVPNSSVMWAPFLERTGGLAPDLPGFGSSAKPAHFPYSIAGYERFLDAFVRHLALERLTLVVHDWGAVGLALAQRRPELVERLVVISCLPFLSGYRWHRFARAWRRPLVGELLMGFTFKRGLRLATREGAAGPLPDAFLDEVWKHFDHGTQRAILKLYRSAPEHELARAGERLGAIGAPALVVWGTEDPYLPAAFAESTAEALGGEARVERFEGAGHWPWLQRPQVVETVAEFVGLPAGGS